MNLLLTAKLFLVFIIDPFSVKDVNTQECSSFLARDCQDVQEIGFKRSDVYQVRPYGSATSYDVYCDMDTDDGGWLVFQRRKDGTVDFNRNWTDYEDGFGDPFGEYWLGNIPIYLLSSKFDYKLRIDIYDWEGHRSYAQYKWFRLGNGFDDYTLYIAGFSGDAGDALKYHNGHRFATADNDHDGCAKNYSGAWWFDHCFVSHLNGEYKQNGEDNASNRGIIWKTWLKPKYSMKMTEMKIKRL